MWAPLPMSYDREKTRTSVSGSCFCVLANTRILICTSDKPFDVGVQSVRGARVTWAADTNMTEKALDFRPGSSECTQAKHGTAVRISGQVTQTG